MPLATRLFINKTQYYFQHYLLHIKMHNKKYIIPENQTKKSITKKMQ